MNFEKIIELIPIAVTIWRTESDYRSDEDITDFRLVYANSQASIEIGHDLFEDVGRKLDSLPPITSSKFPLIPDIWARALISKKSEVLEKAIGKKIFQINVIPLDSKCVASTFRDITTEKNALEKTNSSLQKIKKVATEFDEYRRKKSGNFKLK